MTDNRTALQIVTGDEPVSYETARDALTQLFVNAASFVNCQSCGGAKFQDEMERLFALAIKRLIATREMD